MASRFDVRPLPEKEWSFYRFELVRVEPGPVTRLGVFRHYSDAARERERVEAAVVERVAVRA